MTAQERNEFGKILVEKVRDMAVKSSLVQLYTDNLKSPTARRWRNAKNSGNIDEFAEMVISDAIDGAVFYFLLAIDEGVLHLSFTAPNGEVVRLSDDIIGELGGYYMGEWVSKFSSQRHSNDFDD